jgi:hypothetical protein
MVEFAELPTAWKIIVEPMTGNVVISEVDAFMQLVLSKGGNHVPWGISWYHKLYNVIAEVWQKPRSS